MNAAPIGLPVFSSCGDMYMGWGLIYALQTLNFGINMMPGSPVVDIQNSFGAAFIGLLASTA